MCKLSYSVHNFVDPYLILQFWRDGISRVLFSHFQLWKKGIKFHNSGLLNVILFFKKFELLKFLVNWKKQNLYNVFNRLLNLFALFHFRRYKLVYLPILIFYVLLLLSVSQIFSVISFLHMILNFACLNFARTFIYRYFFCNFGIHG